MKTHWLAALLIGSAALPSVELHAQAADPDTATTPIEIEPVVVEVQSAAFELLKVPYAVAVSRASEEDLAQPGLGLDEVLQGIPGVQVDNRYNYALGDRISIRGFGARAQFGVRGVRVVVDGIPATLPDGQTSLSHVNSAAIGRAEVIRGPASALYGNAAGGVIHLETAAPPPVPLAQTLTAVAGANGLLRLQSSTGGRSGQTSYLLNISRLSYDGYREFSAANRLNATAHLDLEAGSGRWELVAHAVQYEADNPGSLTAALLDQDRTQAYTNNVRQGTGEEGRQGQLGVTRRRPSGGGELEMSGYGSLRNITNPIPPAIIEVDRSVAGGRLLYHSDSYARDHGLRWSVGLDTDLQVDERLYFQNDEGARGARVLDQDETVSGAGAFALLSFPISNRLAVLGGVILGWSS